MSDWYATAAVRRWSWDAAGAASHPNANFFAPKLVPALAHRLLRDGDPALHRRLQQRHLFRYLASTETIEIELVNPALCAVMRRPDLGDFVPQAYRIYTDEGFHAAMCLELRQHLLGRESVPHLVRYHSAGLAQLFAVCAVLTDRELEVALLAAASLNETLITASLRQATDTSVAPIVRQVIDAHATDEAIHHAYFSRLFCAVWDRLDSRSRSRLAELIPILGTALLRADWDAVADDLVAEGIAPSDATRVADDLRDCSERAKPDTVSLAGMIRMLERSGAARYTAVRDYIQSLLCPHKEIAV